MCLSVDDKQGEPRSRGLSYLFIKYDKLFIGENSRGGISSKPIPPLLFNYFYSESLDAEGAGVGVAFVVAAGAGAAEGAADGEAEGVAEPCS